MSLTTEELERYKRHIILPLIGIKGQNKLKDASVLIVGTGGLGSPLAMYLAASGVGTIGLVDFDQVDASNLQRQIIHKTSNVGKDKTFSAQETLQELNPNVTITLFNEALTPENALRIISQFDIVCDGTDNFQTRYLVNDACILTGKTNVFGSIRQFEGQVSVFGAPNGPCYRCLFPEPPEQGTVPSCAEAGVMGVLPGVIGTLQATEVIKLICGIGAPLIGRLLNYDALAMQFYEVKFQKDEDCPCCGSSPSITELKSDNLSCSTNNTISSEIDAQHLLSLLNNQQAPVMIDIRESHEVVMGTIPNSIHIPMNDIFDRMDEIPLNQPVVMFCHLGIRSAHVISVLKNNGYTNLINLKGGIDAYENALKA